MDGGRTDITSDKPGMDNYVDKAGMVINRGWIPYSLKDRSKRGEGTSTLKLVKIQGTMRRSAKVHDYKVPNNPADGVWYNFATEDIARYWEMANFAENGHFYF